MNSLRIIPLLVATALALASFPLAHAAMPVIDVKSIAESAKILQSNQKQITQLGNILGVNTEQLGQLRGITTALGNAQKVANYGERYSPAKIASMIKNVPGLEGVDINSVFKTNGALELFGKVPLGQWDEVVKNPYNYYSQMMMSEAVKNIGEDMGLNTREIQYVNRLKRQNPQFVNKERAARDLADIMLDRWEKEAKDRRTTLQTLSETTNEVANEAGKAETLIEQQAGNTAVLNQAVKVQLAAAEQADAAAIAQKKAIENGNSLLREQIEQEEIRRRASAIRIK